MDDFLRDEVIEATDDEIFLFLEFDVVNPNFLLVF